MGKATTPDDILPRHIGHEGRSVELLKPLCDRLRVPNECRDLALVVAREHGNVHRVMDMGAAALVRMFERSDALRKPARFAEMLQACEAVVLEETATAMRRLPGGSVHCRPMFDRPAAFQLRRIQRLRHD